MNKRARLARRILREHRQGYQMHFTNPKRTPGFGLIWSCTHCSWIGSVGYDSGEEIPRAYR